jgi:hypothetical protein
MVTSRDGCLPNGNAKARRMNAPRAGLSHALDGQSWVAAMTRRIYSARVWRSRRLAPRVPQALPSEPPGRKSLTAGRVSSPAPILYCLLLAWRVDTQRSVTPKPPGRLDEKYSVRASWVSSGCKSATGVFNGGPRFQGGDQGWFAL